MEAVTPELHYQLQPTGYLSIASISLRDYWFYVKVATKLAKSEPLKLWRQLEIATFLHKLKNYGDNLYTWVHFYKDPSITGSDTTGEGSLERKKLKTSEARENK